MADKDRGQPVYEQYDEALFRMAIHELAEEEGRQLQASKEELQTQPEYQPSAAALQRFTQQLDGYLLKQQAKARRRKALRGLNRAAVVVLAICVVLGAAMTTVEAFRTQVLNLWLEIQPQFTIFRLREADPDAGGTELIVDWTNAYVPTYIPAGYRISSIAIKEFSRELVFDDGKGVIIYSEMIDSPAPVIDTEDIDSMETIDVNGHTGILVEKSGITTVIWESEKRLFLIQTWTDPDTALKVARGVKFIK